MPPFEKPEFEMPEFYMPWLARENPHLERARVHANRWARDMGMFDSSQEADGSSTWQTWQARFDCLDPVLFAALTHPDAPASELELVSDWYIWYVYVIYRYDRAGARANVSRLMAFMPMDIPVTPEEPIDPVERGLADLWSRTVPIKSVEWRHRLSEHIGSLVEEIVRERFNLVQDERGVLDPVEFIITRRRLRAWPLKADLVEHALGIEIPPELYRTRPIRVLNDTFADSVNLRIDIISYRGSAEEDFTNDVGVTQNFLDCDLQRAVDIVNNAATSRMYQFEDTAVTELLPLFEEYRTDLVTRTNILTYVKGLQDWMAGNVEWGMRVSGREPEAAEASFPTPPGLPAGPTGLSIVASRFGLSPVAMGLRLRSYQGVPYPPEQYELPEFYMPFPTRLNPHVDALHGKTWAREMGLLAPVLDTPGQWGTWNEDWVETGQFDLLPALAYPDAGLAELELVNDWHTWVVYVRNYVFSEGFKRRRDLLGARVFVSRLPAFMPAQGTLTPVPINPVERALADLWSRSVKVMSARLRRLLARCVEDMAQTLLRELTTLVQNRTPDPLDFLETRPAGSFLEGFQFLIFYALHLENPPEIYLTPPMRSLARTFQTSAAAYIDLFTYPRRIGRERDFNNSIVLIQRFFDCDAQQAVDLLNHLGASQLRRFEYTVATELPHLFEALDLDTNAREGVFRYVEGLQSFLAGRHAFFMAMGAALFSSPGAGSSPGTPLAPRPFVTPTGLGTSAARIASLSAVATPELVSG